MPSPYLPAIAAARPPTSARGVVLFASLATAEVFLTSVLFDFATGVSYWTDPVLYANALAQVGIVALLLLVVVAWPRRREIIAVHDSSIGASSLSARLSLNLVLFAALLAVRFALSRSSPPSFAQLTAYAALLLATGASLALLAAPMVFWRRLAHLVPTEIAIASGGSTLVLVAAKLAQESWNALSTATLAVSHWLLTLYEANVVLDTGQRILGVGDFSVQIYASCSGYEGIGLVVAFLAVYMWVFRHALSFPRTLLLFPLGIAAIWLLNAWRIAALVSIGAHVSPTVAIQGFHSQGGWICFLIVALGLIALSQKVVFFSPAAAGRSRAAATHQGMQSGAQVTLVYLAPFLALMAASVVASAFTPHDQWLYGVKVAAVVAALWWFRADYLGLLRGVRPLSILVGLLIGAAWIATNQSSPAGNTLGAWLASIPVWAVAAWLVLRAIGSVVLVPVAEELAFRGFLYRALVSPKFETVRFDQFRLLALVVSSLAFGFLHERWIAAAIAGVCYALLMLRTKRLSDPIAAHAASNALIVLWAVTAERWSLL